MCIQFKELKFWGLHEQEIEACCWSEYSKFNLHQETLRDLELNCFQRRPNYNSVMALNSENIVRKIFNI